MHAESIMCADMTETVSRRDSCACVARGEALSKAIDLWTKDSLPTIQSSAFFMALVTPCAYSGLAIRSASDARIWVLRSATEGGSEASISGLNNGRLPSPRNTTTSIPGGASRATARSSMVFSDAARRLPEMARILMVCNAENQPLLGTKQQDALNSPILLTELATSFIFDCQESSWIVQFSKAEFFIQPVRIDRTQQPELYL